MPKVCMYNGLNLKQHSLSIGRNDSYFTYIKHMNPTWFRYMVFIGKGSPSIGYYKYIEVVEELRDKLAKYTMSFDSKKAAALKLLELNYTSSFGGCYKAVTSFEDGNCKPDLWTFKKWRWLLKEISNEH